MLYFLLITIVCANFQDLFVGVDFETPSIFHDLMSLLTRNSEEYAHLQRQKFRRFSSEGSLLSEQELLLRSIEKGETLMIDHQTSR